MDYGELLTRGKKDLPDVVSVRERFEIPKVLGHHQGNKTIISNFPTVTSTLNRDPNHLLKYLLRELATSGELRRNMTVFNTKLSAKVINQKIRDYTNKYVLCHECGKPDTELMTEGTLLLLKCQVCGAKSKVRR